MPLLFLAVADPATAAPTRGRRRGRLAFLLALGLIVLGHGCHNGDHEVDNEPSITVPRPDQEEPNPPSGTTRKPV